jgi:acetyltransferase-like isoleucine patch superfamily enzyme
MNLVQRMKDRLRNPQTASARFLRAAVLFVYNFSVRPVGPLKWLYLGLYYVGHAGAEVWRRVLAGILWKPMFMARCRRVGRRLQLEQLPYIIGAGAIELGDDVRISGKIGITFNDRFAETPLLVVGDNTFIGIGSSFSLACRITIGRNCLLSSDVSIRDNDGHPLDPERRARGQAISAESARPVTIGDNVWLGRGCRVLKGVTIGNNSVVGIGSVVNKDVPANCVAAGNPAKVIREFGSDAPTARPAADALEA